MRRTVAASLPALFALVAGAQQFIEAIRREPDRYSSGWSGNYGTMHVPMATMRSAAGLRLLHIAYTGASPAIVALLGHQADALATGPSTVVQHIRSGRLRALAHWGEGRLAALPDVPSLAELGYPVQFSQWSGLFVPAATPEPIAAMLREAARAAANDPKVQQAIGAAGSPILYLHAPEFQRYRDADAARMVDAVKRIGRVD